MFQGNVILRLAHAYIRLSPGPAGELQRRHPAAGRSRVRNVDLTAELFALADLDESRGTLSASRRLSLADLRGASRQINAPPLAPRGRGPHSSRRRVRQMEDMTELQAKLHRVQAEIAESVGRLAKQRGLIANRLAAGEDVSQFLELLATLEDNQLIHVQHRDRLRRKRDGAVAWKNWGV